MTNTLITNPDRTSMAMITLRARLKLEINTGMRASSRGASTLTYCKQWGYNGPARKAAALAWVEEQIIALGL